MRVTTSRISYHGVIAKPVILCSEVGSSFLYFWWYRSLCQLDPDLYGCLYPVAWFHIKQICGVANLRDVKFFGGPCGIYDHSENYLGGSLAL